MYLKQWLLEYQGIASIITLAIVIIAVIPILREWSHKKKYTKVIRAQVRMEVIELIKSFSDKLTHIALNPNIKSVRTLKDEDNQAIQHLEALFEHATYLKKEELQYFHSLITQFRERTFKYKRHSIDKSGIVALKKIAEQLNTILNKKLKDI